MKVTVKKIMEIIEAESISDDAPVFAIGQGGRATHVMVAKGCAGIESDNALIIMSDGTED